MPSPLERIAHAQEIAGDLLDRIEVLPSENPNYIKLKIMLSNEDVLFVREAWTGDVLERYAYYWLDKQNTLKVGWDNVPHHPKIKTHPDHKHVEKQGNVQPSDAKTLKEVLEIIRTEIR